MTITAAAQTKHFGTPAPPFATAYTVTSGSVAPGDSFSGSLIRVAGEAVDSYVILQGSVAPNANYALAYVGANLTITIRRFSASRRSKRPSPRRARSCRSGSSRSGRTYAFRPLRIEVSLRLQHDLQAIAHTSISV